ncbi:MAG: hypothetical protein ACPL3C_06950 [Pyrobaculum sp.]
MRTKVMLEGREVAVEKDARFYKVSSGAIHGHVVIHDRAAVLKALGMRK